MMISVFIPMKIPRATHQQKKFTKNGLVYEPIGVKEARAKYEAYFFKHKPQTRFTQPLGVTLVFQFKERNPKQRGRPKVTRPDLDNMAKLPLDVLTRLEYWNDDNQIADLRLVKVYGEVEGIGLTIKEMANV